MNIKLTTRFFLQ